MSKILKRFREAKNKRQYKDDLWKELDAFDRNQQWDLTNSPPWLPKPVTNYVHLVKYTKRAAFAVENPTAKLRPFSLASVEAVKLLNKAYEDTFDRIKARKAIRESIETMKLLGTAIVQVNWNEVQEGRMGTTVQGDEGFLYTGEIELDVIDPATFFPDPTAFTIEDCNFIFVRMRKSMEWVKANPKFKVGEDAKEEGLSYSEPQARGEIYHRDYNSESDDSLVDFMIYYEREANSAGGFSYFATYLVNDKIVLDKEPLIPNRYPFAIGYDFKQRQDFWAMSTCQFILDNQKIINKVESIIAMIGTLLQNPQRVVTASSGINPKNVATYGNAPGQTWLTNDANASQSIHYVQPPQIPIVLFNMLEQAKQNIREITGLTESYMGQNVGSLQTSSGVQALIDRATMRDRDQMYDIELFVEDLSKLIIDFMCTYYEEERLIRVIDKATDEVEFIPFVGTEFKDLAYDMSVDVSSKAPITRMREAQEAKELLNLQGQYGANYSAPIIKPQEAIEMMNLMNGNRIIERMNFDEMNNKVEQAMQVAQMIAEATQAGVGPEEVNQMAMAMFEQMENPQAAKQTGAPASFNPQNIPQG